MYVLHSITGPHNNQYINISIYSIIKAHWPAPSKPIFGSFLYSVCPQPKQQFILKQDNFTPQPHQSVQTCKPIN